MEDMPASNFPFSMDSLRIFTEACRHAQELYQCESPPRLVKRMSAESSDLRGRLDGIVHG